MTNERRGVVRSLARGPRLDLALEWLAARADSGRLESMLRPLANEVVSSCCAESLTLSPLCYCAVCSSPPCVARPLPHV